MFYWDQFWLTQSAFILYGTVDLDIVNCMIHSADPGPIHASKKGNLYRLPFFEAWIGPGSAECIIQFTISKSTVPYKIKALCVNQNWSQ